MFGYLRPELEGKNVAMLMPPPFSMQHHNFLRSFKQTQKGVLLGSGPRDVIGLHKNGFVFPVKLSIEKSASAEGYTGVFHEVSPRCVFSALLVCTSAYPTQQLIL